MDKNLKFPLDFYKRKAKYFYNWSRSADPHSLVPRAWKIKEIQAEVDEYTVKTFEFWVLLS